MNNSLGKCLGLIIIGTYQADVGDRRWLYEPASDLFPYVEPNSGSVDEAS